MGRTPGSVGNGAITVSMAQSTATAIAMTRAPEGTLLVDGTDVYIKTAGAFLDSAAATAGAPSASAAFVTANVLVRDADGNEDFYENLGFGGGHPRFIGDMLNTTPTRRIDQLENTFAIEPGTGVDGFRMHAILSALTAPVPLTGGNDGGEPTAASYTTPLDLLARNDDISIVGAPGYSSYGARNSIQDALITHVELRRAYRFAVLEVPQNQTTTDALATKARIDSSYAGIYYPWVVTANPLSQPSNASIPRELTLPPTGFVCGIFAYFLFEL